MSGRYADKLVVITGAAGGIGVVTARILADLIHVDGGQVNS